MRQPKLSKVQIESFTTEAKVWRDKREKIMKDHARKIVKEGMMESFYIFDLAEIDYRVKTWRKLMPRVELFYASKCLFDDAVMKRCSSLGCGFDVASPSEIKHAIDLGVSTQNLIYANPVKTEPHIAFAKENGTSMMTFDSEEELHKIHRNFPTADCVIRIQTVCTAALYNLNEKFGVSMNEVPALLEAGKKLGLRMKGVSFHTGSGGVKLESYENSLKNARKVFDIAQGLGMPEMDLLDIGGGFTLILPNSAKNFEEVAP